MSLDPSEDFARAITAEKWDEATGEMSPSLFTGPSTSVSRLSLCPLEDTWDLFRRTVEKPPDRTLARIGTMNVGRLVEIGKNHKEKPTALSVASDPQPDYPSHAIIPGKLSRGLANAIIREVIVHNK